LKIAKRTAGKFAVRPSLVPMSGRSNQCIVTRVRRFGGTVAASALSAMRPHPAHDATPRYIP
jgi:hypothetical protein